MLFIMVAFLGLQAGQIKENLTNLFPNSQIISSDKISSLKLNLVAIKDTQSGKISLMLCDDLGQNFVYVNGAFFKNQNDAELFGKKENLLKDEHEMAVFRLLKTISDDRFLAINSFYKDNKNVMYMITDPLCPYCKKELKKIVKFLRNANLRIIFAPVHDKDAFIRSAIMLKKSKKIDPNDQKLMIELLNYYFDEKMKLNNDDINFVTENEVDLVFYDAKKVFSKGLVKGVPFVFTIKE